MKPAEQIKIVKIADGHIIPIMDIIKRTGFFRSVEEDIALEVLQDSVNNPTCGYNSFTAMLNDKPVGWICFGQTPCTIGTFDIYWIAVDPNIQRCHIGSKLLEFAENQITKQGGRIMIIETSGSEKYKPTQKFYEKNGYILAANVDDFYAENDPKMIFTKKTAAININY